MSLFLEARNLGTTEPSLRCRMCRETAVKGSAGPGASPERALVVTGFGSLLAVGWKPPSVPCCVGLSLGQLAAQQPASSEPARDRGHEYHRVSQRSERP